MTLHKLSSKYADQNYQVYIGFLIQRHRITEIFFTICNPSAIEADEFRILHKFLYTVEFFLACKHTQVSGVVSDAFLVGHFFPYLILAVKVDIFQFKWFSEHFEVHFNFGFRTGRPHCHAHTGGIRSIFHIVDQHIPCR